MTSVDGKKNSLSKSEISEEPNSTLNNTPSSEQKRWSATRELQKNTEADESHELLFEWWPVPALIVSASGLIVQANNEAAHLFGFRSSKLLVNHSIYRLVAKQDRQLISESILSIKNRDSAVIDRVCAISQDSDFSFIEMHITKPPVYFDRYSRSLITCIDKTDIYSANSEYALIKTIADNSDTQIIAFNRAGECIYVNAVAAKSIGNPPSSILGTTRHYWMSEAEATRKENQDAIVLTTQEHLITEEKVTQQDGTNRYYIFNRFPIYTDGPDISGVATIATEITNQKEDETRLKLAMAAFSKGHEGILITDHNNNIISVNTAFESITGYTEKEVLGKNPKTLSSGRHDRSFYKQMWNSVVDNGYWEGEIWNRDKSGRVYPEWLSISRIPGDQTSTSNYIGIFSDITKRKLVEQEVEQLAFYDTLTGVANRYLLNDRTNQAIHRANREGSRFALLFLDLDHFKEINDAHGHEIGDEVLRKVVSRISKTIREKDTISRLGGDEFVLLLEDIDEPTLKERLDELLFAINLPLQVDDKSLNFSVSAGIAIYPKNGDNFNSLLKNADTAMYRAKSSGRNTYCFFDGEMATTAKRRSLIMSDLREAVKGDQFSLAYQPQISARENKVVGIEALIRWKNSEGIYVPPAEFIPIAEQSGIINEIGAWVIENTCNSAKSADLKGIRYAINVSAQQFESNKFVEQIADALNQSGMSADHIELEVTENIIMLNPDKTVAIMNSLKEMGVSISIDDFGTGYSSLAYLHWMPVDKIKIDQSFISHIGVTTTDESICRSIVSLAKSLDIITVAEGVETEEQYQFLSSIGCDYIQGYLFSPPLPFDSLQNWLSEFQLSTD